MDRFPGSVVFAREPAYTSRDDDDGKGVSGDGRASYGTANNQSGLE